MSDPILGPSEHDRMLLAQRLGWHADETFRLACLRVGLDPAWACIGSPLLNLAAQWARIRHGGRA